LSSVDVVVVGAGLAGLSSARQLRKAGASVALLEARDRVGGRAMSLDVTANLTIDLGAQFIGDSQTRISSLVDEAGLTRVRPFTLGEGLYFPTPNKSSHRLNGDNLPLGILQKLDLHLANVRIDRSTKNLEDQSKHLLQISAQQFLQDVTLSQQSRTILTHLIEPEICYPLEKISAFHLLTQVKAMGGLAEEADSTGWFLKEGVGGVLKYLMEEAKPSLLLNSPAMKFTKKSGKFEVETASTKYIAQDVIIAVPPHLYKGMGLYNVLTPDVQSEIDFFQPGLVVKTILVFDKPWWRDSGLTGRSISGGGLFNATMDASPEDGSYGVLVLFSTSTSGALLGEIETESERVKAAVKWLEGFGVAPIPKLITSKSVNWNSGPVALGGYSNARTLGGIMKHSQLFSSTEGIHFAGSETATEWSSFMEGALQSAERAVARINHAT
jgi:monoamine oxidase